MAQNKWSSFTSAITTAEEAEKVTKDSAHAFFFLAALMTVLVIISGQYWNLSDALGMAIPAAFLKFRQSRGAAVFLLVLSVAGGAVTVANRLGLMDSGGKNVILAVITVWAAVRAVQATFKLHALRKAAAVSVAPALIR